MNPIIYNVAISIDCCISGLDGTCLILPMRRKLRCSWKLKRLMLTDICFRSDRLSSLVRGGAAPALRAPPKFT